MKTMQRKTALAALTATISILAFTLLRWEGGIPTGTGPLAGYMTLLAMAAAKAAELVAQRLEEVQYRKRGGNR